MADEFRDETQADQPLRVNVDRLDRLTDLVGELSLVRNELVQGAREDGDCRLSGPIAQLNRITTDLQHGVLQTRMQPVGSVWNKWPQLVRELSRVAGSQIDLQLRGVETELDRTVLEAIHGALLHLIRNAAVHGIERPEVRRSLGKPETGRIRLTALLEGNHVLVSVEDDGTGIRRRIAAEDADGLSDADVAAWFFSSSSSVAEPQTSSSPRRGLEIVRTEIERIGGTLDLASEPGQGTCVRLKIPRTRAILSALIVEAAGRTFAIPQLAVVEVVRVAGEDRRRLERSDQQDVIRLHERLIPVLSLAAALNLSASPSDDADELHLVIVQVGVARFGLKVDAVRDSVEELLLIRLAAERPGVLGTASIAGVATEILDLQHCLRQIPPRRTTPPPEPKTALVIDDSLFFRQLLRTALDADGYRATAVDSAERAMEQLEQGKTYDAILCDIELPGADGCEFARWCRNRPATMKLPLVAMTSLDEETHGARILGSGFDRMLVKFQPQQLRHTLRELLQNQTGAVA